MSDDDSPSKTGYCFEYGPGGVKINRRYETPAIVEEHAGLLSRLALRIQYLGGMLRPSDSLLRQKLGEEIFKFGVGSWRIDDFRIERADDLDFDAIVAAGGSVDRGPFGAWYLVDLPDDEGYEGDEGDEDDEEYDDG